MGAAKKKKPKVSSTDPEIKTKEKFPFLISHGKTITLVWGIITCISKLNGFI